MKKLLSLLTAMLIAITMVASADLAITVKVNGKAIDLKDAAAFVDKSNRTLVPLRFIADNLNATTDWNQSTKTATVTQGDKVIALCIPCKWVKINGTETSTDSYGLVKNNRTYVPLRLIAEAFGAKVGYANRVVTITTSGGSSPTYPQPDTSKMDKLSQDVLLKQLAETRPGRPLYDGAHWNWNVQLITGGVSETGFGIRYTESRASALYVITTTGEWIRDGFPFPGAASYEGNHIGKEIDKVFFSGGGNDYLVDIPNIKIEKQGA